jgi:predicted DsbA family dithiol-disulfide isomerase
VAAVPEVHSTIEGMPLAVLEPNAMNEAVRSSWATSMRSSGRAAIANAIGVLREPGAMTAWRTPSRIHWSTNVAQNVTWALGVSGAKISVGTRGTIRPYRVDMRTVIDVEVWSDVVCPWCFIGKRRFERAVADVADEIEVRWTYRPYQLDPTASPGKATPVIEGYAKKFGGPERAAQIIEQVTAVAAGEGLEFRMDRALRANTLLAHRLLWLTEATGHQHAMKERLLQAYFHDGLDIGDPGVLAGCAADIGLEREAVRAFLDSDDGVAEVQTMLQFAAEHEITAVPTFVIAGAPGGQSWMVPGAQDAEVFASVLRRLAAKRADD